MPAPGELHIKDRRTWKTWQLVTAMLAAALVGMALNYHTVGATQSSNAPAYVLPKSTGSTTTTTPSSAADSSGSSTTTTAAAGGSSGSTPTTTAAAGGSTATSAPSSTSSPGAGPARVLMGPTQLQGNWTSPAFTTTVAGWNIGWAFNCSPAPAAGTSFQVFVTPAGSSSPTGTPAISETGPSGQSVTAQSSLGAQTLVVQAPASCTWAVKVTGS